MMGNTSVRSELIEFDIEKSAIKGTNECTASFDPEPFILLRFTSYRYYEIGGMASC